MRRLKMKLSNDEKRTAALKVYCLWSWLAKNLGKNKADYPLFDELGIGSFEHECPWCAMYRTKLGCARCPLDQAQQSCLYSDSYYGIWKCSDDSVERHVAAGGIANVAWKEYKKFERKS